MNTGISNNTDSNADCRYSGSKVHVDSATKVAVRVTVICQPYVSGYDNSPPNAQYSAQYTLRVDLLHGGSYGASKLGAGNAFTVDVAGVSHGIEITSEHSGSSRANLQQIRPIPVDLEQETGLSTSAVLNSIKAADHSNWVYSNNYW